MPMKSKAQRRYLWATDPELARKFEDKTPKGTELPDKVEKEASSCAQILAKLAEDRSFFDRNQVAIRDALESAMYTGLGGAGGYGLGRLVGSENPWFDVSLGAAIVNLLGHAPRYKKIQARKATRDMTA